MPDNLLEDECAQCENFPVVDCVDCECKLCEDCSHECNYCENSLCTECSINCQDCGQDLCEECSVFCNPCERVFCGSCIDENYGTCVECTSAIEPEICYGCDEYIDPNADHYECDNCEEVFCESCFEPESEEDSLCLECG